MPPPRRQLFDFAKRFLVENIDIDPLGLNADDSPPRLTFQAITKILPLMSRTREKILNNLDALQSYKQKAVRNNCCAQ